MQYIALNLAASTRLVHRMTEIGHARRTSMRNSLYIMAFHLVYPASPRHKPIPYSANNALQCTN